MSKYAGLARRDEQLSVGKYVLLSTKFLRLFHVGSCLTAQLLNKYLGPIEMLSLQGAVAYEYCLPASVGRMFNVFHVSLLKRYKDGNWGCAT